MLPAVGEEEVANSRAVAPGKAEQSAVTAGHGRTVLRTEDGVSFFI